MHGHMIKRVRARETNHVYHVYLEALRIWVVPALSLWTHLPLVFFLFSIFGRWMQVLVNHVNGFLVLWELWESHEIKTLSVLSDCPTELPVFLSALWPIFLSPQRHIILTLGVKLAYILVEPKPWDFITLNLFCKFLHILLVRHPTTL